MKSIALLFLFCPIMAMASVIIEINGSDGAAVEALFTGALHTTGTNSGGITSVVSTYSTPNQAFSLTCNTQIEGMIRGPTNCKLNFDSSKIENEFTLMQGGIGNPQTMLVNQVNLNQVLKSNLKSMLSYTSFEKVKVQFSGRTFEVPRIEVDCGQNTICTITAIPDQSL